jgi:hypothetical protein|tara:strand:- start:89 stop:1837 length:1749 start_codon:yes stop_codon:yes gene_type:complete
MSAILPINYFNSFLIKRVGFPTNSPNGSYVNTWPGIFYNPVGYGTYPINAAQSQVEVQGRNYYIEEARIRGGYNNVSVNFGIKAYVDEEIIDQQHRFNTLIYSGIYNSRTGFNATNVFSVGESITKSVDPSYGSIQKLYQSDTNLTILQENKSSYALVDKDALYTAEGSSSLTSTNLVIGQIVPFNGTFGISKNPQSFATFGFRRYFTDVHRGSVMRLSNDGLTEISNYGMTDYFRDMSSRISDDLDFFRVEAFVSTSGSNATIKIPTEDAENLDIGMRLILNNVSTNVYVTNINFVTGSTITTIDLTSTVSTASGDTVVFVKPVIDKVIGGWDNHNRMYTVSYQKALTAPIGSGTRGTVALDFTVGTGNTNTLIFDEKVNGWTSFYSYRPTSVFSLKGDFYSTNTSGIWKHYSNTSDNNNRGVFYNIPYASSLEFVINNNPSVKKVFQTVSYEGDNGYQVSYFKSDIQRVDADLDGSYPPTYAAGNSYQDTTPLVYSYDQGFYTDALTGQPKRAGFTRKENLYTSNLINNSTARPDEILFGESMSGIKGYFATVKISTDNYTDVGGLKELWSVGSKFVQSS